MLLRARRKARIFVLYICPHTACLSSYYYIFVLILQDDEEEEEAVLLRARRKALASLQVLNYLAVLVQQYKY